MLLHRNKAPGLALVLTIALLAGCSGTNEDWSNANPDSQGYQWRGQGEPGNFGAAYGFCRSTVGDESVGQRLEGGAGPFTTATGGPNVIPGYERNVQVARSGAPVRRQFNDCMASQGWTSSEPEPTPRKF